MELYMNYKTLFFVMIFIIVGCDAHMQKGLEVYQERYTEPVTDAKVDRTRFFMIEDDVDAAFSASDTQPRVKIKQEDAKPKEGALKQVTKAEVLSEAGVLKVVFHGDGELDAFRVIKNPEKKEIMVVVKNVENAGIANTLDANSDTLKRIKIARDKTQKHFIVIFEFFTNAPLPELQVQKEKDGFSVKF